MVLIGAGLLVLGIAGLALLPRGSNGQARQESEAVTPVEVHFPAPELSLQDLQGNPVSLADYRGRFVLINNWATWCPPCRAEMPTLEAYYQDHRLQNFELIAIEAGDATAEVAEFVQDYRLSFPVWLDPQNRSLQGFKNQALPNSYLIDPDGTTILAWSGAISEKMLEAFVTPYLEE
jgi:thiol-disulfide isomerase/thioredoxin